MSSTANGKRALDIALLGTRGVPASYGGFETFARELSTRLVERGHRVTVYGRSHYVDPRLVNFRGVRIRVLPSLRTKYLETVSHAAISVLEALFHNYDVLLICNAANAFLCGIPGLRGQKVVLNVDGIERQRRKWSPLGKVHYRLGEFLATLLPDRAVTDARVIRRYYLEEYGFESLFIPYGAPAKGVASREILDELGLEPGRYLLYVSRLEPENNAHRVIRAYRGLGIHWPLVVVGGAPYARGYVARLEELARDANVLLPGPIYGRGYRELLSHCLCYIHATEVGGTHPALLEAMGAGAIVLVNDTPENREVVGSAGLLYAFNDSQSLGRLMQRVCSDPRQHRHYRGRAQQRVRECYSWESVVARYESLFYELIDD